MILDDHVDSDPKISYFFLGANSNTVARRKCFPMRLWATKPSAKPFASDLRLE